MKKFFLLVLCLVACHKTVEQRHDLDLTQQVATTHNEATEQDKQAKNEVTTEKVTGPSEITTRKIEEDFGWVPPPPDAPVGTKPQWKPIHKVVEKTTTKTGQVDEKVTATGDSVEVNKTLTADTAKADTKVKEKDVIKTKTDVGLSFLTKLGIVGGIVLLLIILVAIFQPALLKTVFGLVNDLLTKLRNKIAK